MFINLCLSYLFYFLFFSLYRFPRSFLARAKSADQVLPNKLAWITIFICGSRTGLNSHTPPKIKSGHFYLDLLPRFSVLFTFSFPPEHSEKKRTAACNIIFLDLMDHLNATRGFLEGKRYGKTKVKKSAKPKFIPKENASPRHDNSPNSSFRVKNNLDLKSGKSVNIKNIKKKNNKIK